MRKIYILLCLTLFLSHFSSAYAASTADAGESKAELLSEYESIAPGQSFYVALKLTLLPGWHTYWKNPGDAGLTPSITWTLPKGAGVGEIVWPNPMRMVEGPLMTYGYLDAVTLPIQVTAPKDLKPGESFTLQLTADWLTCLESCIPQTAELDLTLPVADQPHASAVKADIDRQLSQKPARIKNAATATSQDALTFTIAKSEFGVDTINDAYFFPAGDGFAYGEKQSFEANGDQLTLHVPLAQQDSTAAKPQADGVLLIEAGDGTLHYFQITPESCHVGGDTADGGAAGTLPAMLLFALLGGLILNLMPCVFPVLSFKALALAKHAGLHPQHAKTEGLAYTAGVILSFLVLAGSLIALRGAGDAVGWGFQMQSPAFVGALCFLMLAVGLNLSGLFELPTVFGSLGSSLASEDSLRGSFFTGVLAVLVAAPCTAPFMATALGFALSQPTAVALLVFAALGLGLALPFLLIGFFPKLVSFLPKPGAWMQRFREFLAFPMYATAIWLLWVLGRQAGSDSVALVLLSGLAMAFGFWLCLKPGTVRKLIAMVFILLLPALTLTTLHTLGRDVPMIAPEHGEIPYSAQKLSELRAQGKPVFVDATAAWCITCQVNKRVALATKASRKAFAEKDITMMVADWTNADPEITALLESFGFRGVPMYVYFPANNAEPVILPQLLTEDIVLEAIGAPSD